MILLVQIWYYVVFFITHIENTHLFEVYCLYNLQVYNKVDQISIEEVDRLARRPHSVVIRCVSGSSFGCQRCHCTM